MQSNKQLANKIKTKAYKDLSEQTQMVMDRLKDNADDDKAFISVLLEIDVALKISNFFETNLHNEFKRRKFNEVLATKIDDICKPMTTEQQQEYSEYLANILETQYKTADTIKKRAFDCINRHNNVERSLLHSIMMIETLNYEQLNDSQQEQIVSTLKRAEIDCTFAQLDLILLYAVEKYYPMAEINNVIDRYKLGSTELFNLWQSVNSKYKQAHGVDIYNLDVEQPHTASKIFERRAEVLDTREKLHKNIDSYGGQFLKDDEIQKYLKKGANV